jgi:hypothetical protein
VVRWSGRGKLSKSWKKWSSNTPNWCKYYIFLIHYKYQIIININSFILSDIFA